MISLLPECHVRGNKAPSKHFRLGFRLDRYGSKCTLSFSQKMRKKNIEMEGIERWTFIKTPLLFVIDLFRLLIDKITGCFFLVSLYIYEGKGNGLIAVAYSFCITNKMLFF